MKFRRRRGEVGTEMRLVAEAQRAGGWAGARHQRFAGNPTGPQRSIPGCWLTA